MQKSGDRTMACGKVGVIQRYVLACFAMGLEMLCGCGVSYNTNVRLGRPTSQDHTAYQEEQQRVELAVQEVTRSFGLRPKADSLGVRQSIEADDSVPFRIVDEFVRGKDRETSYSNIVVIVAQVKQTGQFEVRIRDLGSTHQTSFTRSLEQSLVKALQEQLPGYTVTVDRSFEPLILGP